MSVKKRDRHTSKNDILNQVRKLNEQLLILTRPREFDNKGNQITKPGLLGEGQPLQAFGLDIFKCGKAIHSACWQASKIYLRDEETLAARKGFYDKALAYCTSILQQLDLCLYTYARNNKKKRKSFEYAARLTYNVKQGIYDRINRDKLIYLHQYTSPKHKYRR